MSRSIALFPIMVVGMLLRQEHTAAAETANPGASSWSRDHVGQPLKLDNYQLAFSDEFGSPSVTNEQDRGAWMAPVHSAYGVASFDLPGGSNGTYTVADGMLKIRATKTSDGKWHAGSVQTTDGAGRGFAQQYGYFEARMKFPKMPGAWCAFWLKSQAEHSNAELVRSEIDVIEWYGGDPRGHHSTVHLWPPKTKVAGRLSAHWYKSLYTKVDGMADQWHTYGALITPELVIIYVDREEISRFPTFEEYKTPLYPLVSLTLHAKDVAQAVSPFEMQVDYVKVYALHTPKSPALDDVR